jgi:hypothetical protein
MLFAKIDVTNFVPDACLIQLSQNLHALGHRRIPKTKTPIAIGETSTFTVSL